MADYVGSVSRTEVIIDAQVEHGKNAALRMLAMLQKSIGSLHGLLSFFDIAPGAVSTSEGYALLPADKREVVAE